MQHITSFQRLSKVSNEQADALSCDDWACDRSAYTNIQTVKLFAHAGRESSYAKASMQEFMVTVYKQMRLGAKYEISILFLNIVLYAGVLGTAVWSWMNGRVELGVIAAATAMILKLSSIAEFIMWQTSALFESVGTIQDGMKTLGRFDHYFKTNLMPKTLKLNKALSNLKT